MNDKVEISRDELTSLVDWVSELVSVREKTKVGLPFLSRGGQELLELRRTDEMKRWLRARGN